MSTPATEPRNGASGAATVEDVARAFDVPLSMVVSAPPTEAAAQPATVTLVDGSILTRPATLHPTLVIRGTTTDGLLVVSDTTLPAMPPWALTPCCHAAASCFEDGTLYCKGCYEAAPWACADCGEHLVEVPVKAVA